MRFPARSLFTCWLAMVATGAVVSHQHADARQTHGFGWTSLSTPVVEAEVDPTLPHRHFILLGIEFGAVPGGTERVDTHLPNTPSVDPVADDAVAPVDSEPVFLPIPTTRLTVAFILPADHALTESAFPSSIDNSCPFISHTRTGILRS